MPTYSDPVRQAVWEIYRGRCIICLGQGHDVHEIVPRSLAPQTWMAPENRVVLCREHHTQVHNEGTRAWAERLKERAAFVQSLFE